MPGEIVVASNLGPSLALDDDTDTIDVDADEVVVSVAGVTATTLNAALLEIFNAANA